MGAVMDYGKQCIVVIVPRGTIIASEVCYLQIVPRGTFYIIQ